MNANAIRPSRLPACLMLTLLAVMVGQAAAERPGWDNSRIVGRATTPGPYEPVEVFTEHTFHFPVAMRTVPRADDANAPPRLLVAELRGQVHAITYRDGDEPQRDLMFDLELGDPAESGSVWGWLGQFYAVEFDPQYPQRSFVYICYNIDTSDGRVNRLSRLTVTQHEPPRADLDTEHVLIEWPSSGHNGADVHFGPDGMLYVSTGDGAPPRDPENIGQTVDNFLGSILRIDVNVPPDDDRGYRVPEDNPFAAMDDVQPEVWAYGLRNPFRMSFDPDGRLWLGDNGEEAWELLHIIRKGANYGWSTYEGSHPFRPDNPLAGPTPELTPPVVEHPHTEARSLMGGITYQGERHDELHGHYIYGDHVTRRLWALRWDAEAEEVTDHRLISQTGYQLLGFAEDHDRQLYITTAEGAIIQLRRRPDADPADDQPGEPFPQRLSETGLLASVAEHEPAEGVIEYHVNAPAWRDGARGERLLAMPASAGFQPDQQRQWNLPDGGAAAMTLSLPVPDDEADDGIRWRRVETRLIHRDQGLWHFHTYRWNEDESDAYLVGDTGDNATYDIIDPQTQQPTEIAWRYQTGSECATCHVREAGLTLGLNARQLNSAGSDGRNQLSVMHELGLLFVDASAPEALPQHVDPHDASAALDARARAYLAANCAHCHREGGAGGRAPFDARADLSLEQMGMLGVTAEVPVHTGEGGKLVQPGSPDDSELWQRVAAPLIGRMPPIGSTQVDDAGVELLKQWILGLDDP